ncbi:hypothetical protein OPKNFCMD_0271 [Methylobacterium crusticola]|uniref:DUF4198 domain-containing protein n=1 Tax=Methylobacterium crusticola TaxID=1697972 RepID=A0ABQ4QQL4_9HYPH|nr:DUF4198 domain-containing protein [Methylobacterium crusticola]GJD47563.1 hypothetical protein OPKNFCMD_0271 [Methylobacterium crusticola]
MPCLNLIRTTVLGAALALAGRAPGAAAHDLWLTLSNAEAGPQVRVNFGHPGQRRTPNLPKVLDLAAETPEGSTDLRPALKPAAADVPPALVAALPTKPARTLVAARYDAGYWVTLRDGGRRNASRRVAPDAREARWAMKFAKAAFGPAAPWQKVVGHTLEIVPLEVPAATAGAIRVRVLFRGAPLPGAALIYGEGTTDHPGESRLPVYTTDAEGVATVPIRKAGAQVVTVSQTVSPSATPMLADEDVYTASFAFRLDEPSVN